MNKFLIAAFSAAFLFSAHAKADECIAVYEFSGRVMKLRQGDAPQEDLYRLIKGLNGPDEIKRLANAIIKKAYDVPVFFRQSQVDEITASFSEDIYRLCRGSKK